MPFKSSREAFDAAVESQTEALARRLAEPSLGGRVPLTDDERAIIEAFGLLEPKEAP